MLSAIADRRSIRKFNNKAVPRQMLEEIMQAGILAPSSKNRQPWKFIVTTGFSKDNVLAAMGKGLEREKKSPLLPESAEHLKGAENTLNIMCQAPVIIYIVNPLGIDIRRSLSPEERIYEICNAQSIGAAIENMTLTATEFGLGSLWICDTYFAYKELSACLKTNGELFAAMALGYAEENPTSRPRKNIDNVVEWRN
ncbi:MAG: nitroreductase family protein [Lachnospiraceae bacterium]